MPIWGWPLEARNIAWISRLLLKGALAIVHPCSAAHPRIPIDPPKLCASYILMCNLLCMCICTHIYIQVYIPIYIYFSAQQQSLHPSSKPTSCTCASCNSHDGCQGPANVTQWLLGARERRAMAAMAARGQLLALFICVDHPLLSPHPTPSPPSIP